VIAAVKRKDLRGRKREECSPEKSREGGGGQSEGIVGHVFVPPEGVAVGRGGRKGKETR